jgi:hypothetical protein
MSDKTPRDRMHAKYCPDDQCTLEYSQPGGLCRNFDVLLDRVERDALHHAAVDFDQRIEKLPRIITPGVSYVVREMDPFEKIDAFDPNLHDVHPSEFSDCPKCGEGVEHWHIKGTQDPVRWL